MIKVIELYTWKAPKLREIQTLKMEKALLQFILPTYL